MLFLISLTISGTASEQGPKKWEGSLIGAGVPRYEVTSPVAPDCWAGGCNGVGDTCGEEGTAGGISCGIGDISCGIGDMKGTVLVMVGGLGKPMDPEDDVLGRIILRMEAKASAEMNRSRGGEGDVTTLG